VPHRPLFRRYASTFCASLAALGTSAALAEPPCGPIPVTAAAASNAATVPDIPTPLDPNLIDVTVAGADAVLGGSATLKGPLIVRQGARTLSAQDGTYDAATLAFDVRGNVEYRDALMSLGGEWATWNAGGGGRFSKATFELPSRPARGRADSIVLDTDGELHLSRVEYTACPAGHEDWMLRAQRIDIDQAAQQGVGRNVRIDFKGVPILYLPIVSFPVGDARKSGFLFPIVGQSNRNGFEVAAPYYFNLAPNYDATLTPGYMSKRGLTLGSEFRFLTASSHGIFSSDWIPSDASARRDRSMLRFSAVSDLGARLRFDTNLAHASDSNYFQDFGLGPEGTSVTFLQRVARLTYLDDHWRAIGLVEQFQTIDQTVLPIDRPYTRAPELGLRGRWNEGNGAGFEVAASAVDFVRSTGVEAIRVGMAPTASFAWRGPGAFVIPAIGLQSIHYSLRNTVGGDTSPGVSAPIATLAAGLNFERDAGRRVQTLEPRLLYTYVPYRDQSALPLFDTGLPDLNFVQLFRSQRYVGGDRIGDANQLAVGATTRLVDATSGRQLLAATLGQIYYFSPPRVQLPSEPPGSSNSSDLVGQVEVSAYRHWNVQLAEQWDPHSQQSARTQLRLQYQPAPNKVANIGYRYRRDLLEQVEGSFSWPIAQSWNVYAREVYSLREKTSIESFGGFEYQACCWRVRMVARHYVSSRTGTRDTTISLQLELNGLSSVGERADAFLARSIRGYSATQGPAGSE
jgi:LPS-assembly protein